jgi:hypothetical protein
MPTAPMAIPMRVPVRAMAMIKVRVTTGVQRCRVSIVCGSQEQHREALLLSWQRSRRGIAERRTSRFGIGAYRALCVATIAGSTHAMSYFSLAEPCCKNATVP